MRRLALAAAGTVAAGVACIGYGVLVERHAFRVRQVRVPVLPLGEAPIRVLHVSDLHVSLDRRRLIEYVDALGGLRPDLVVSTGDNISSAEAVEAVVGAYRRLFRVPGVFVFGSNDYYAPTPVNPLSYFGLGRRRRARPELPHAELRAALVAGGWFDVEHRRLLLSVAGRQVEVRGTKDAHIGLDDYSTVAGPACPDAVVSLGVTHAPYLRLLDAMAADRLDGNLASLLDPWQPAVLEMIRHACNGGRATGKPIGVCGEAGGDPLLALVLTGLGVASLSMAPSKVKSVRAALRMHDLATCQQMAAYAVDAPSAQEGRENVVKLVAPAMLDLL